MSVAKLRNVHVLFVHGVGTHAHLSSLLQAYQSFRSDTRLDETSAKGDVDPIDGWRLKEFHVGAPTARLKLVEGAENDAAVYLYEVNYSALANVVRKNHPIDLTTLFVSFDLAVNVARSRLREPKKALPGGFDIDHQALAMQVQKLVGVFVAATVPILGIPSLVFKQFTHNAVSIFTRFFEDITTFALDPNGENLISRHVDQTVRSIFEFGKSLPRNPQREYERDVFAVAGHSLGSIVAHSFLIRHRKGDRDFLPQHLLTFGSPIGIVSWLWLFLDFKEMNFEKPNDTAYFTWDPLPKGPPLPDRMQWINVVNHLDPIASAFPIDYVDLAGSPAENAAALTDDRIHQRFIRAGSAWTGHTSYFDDREGFLEILARLARLREGDAVDVRNPDAASRDPHARPRELHWQEALQKLRMLSRLWWAGGVLAMVAYLGGIALLCKSCLPLLFLLAYGWPNVTVGTLAYFQRLLHTRPSKRTSVAAILSLCGGDIRSRPHYVRQKCRGEWSLDKEQKFVEAPRPGWVKKSAVWVGSFIPSLVAMVLPVLLAWQYADGWSAGWKYFTENWKVLCLVALGLFMLNLVCFAISEFLKHWRAAISIAAKQTL